MVFPGENTAATTLPTNSMTGTSTQVVAASSDVVSLERDMMAENVSNTEPNSVHGGSNVQGASTALNIGSSSSAAIAIPPEVISQITTAVIQAISKTTVPQGSMI